MLTSPTILLGIRQGRDVWYYIDLAKNVGTSNSESPDIEFGRLHGWESHSRLPQVLTLLTSTLLEQSFDERGVLVPEQPLSCLLISIYGANPDTLFGSFETAGAIRPLKPGGTLLPSGFSVPVLASNVERELRVWAAAADPYQDTSVASERMSENCECTETHPVTEEHARFPEDLDIAE
jgi:hypothetical protein